MKRVLLKETRIGDTLIVDFEQNEEQVVLAMGSCDAMTVYAMEIEVWKDFVRAVNQANIIQKLEEIC